MVRAVELVTLSSGRHRQALTSSISLSVIAEIVAVETLMLYSSST